jgi:hypothetical protein
MMSSSGRLTKSLGFWQTSATIIVLSAALVVPLRAAQSESDDARLSFFENATRSLVRGFKDLICPSLREGELESCKLTPIVVTKTWGIGAFAAKQEGRPVITISAGLSAFIDNVTWAKLITEAITGHDDCFLNCSSDYLRTIELNQHNIDLAEPLKHAKNITEYADTNIHDCKDVDSEHIKKLMTQDFEQQHTVDVSVELTFILLHELAHVINGDIDKQSFLSLGSRQNIEISADSWAIHAATKANVSLIDSITPFWLTLLQGNSKDWEEHSGHPLGVRRALNFLSTLRADVENSTELRRSLEQDGKYEAVIAHLNNEISVTTLCLRELEKGNDVNCLDIK